MSDSSVRLKLLELCEAALDVDDAARTTWLTKQCGDDQQMLCDALALMARVSDNDDALTGSLFANAKVGDQIGPYEIEQTIGHGGMGTVYQARRLDAPFEQAVALKVLRAHVVTESLRLRFDLERRVLARLSHPYIANLIDGGTTPEGLPWLVMELVDGVPIDEYCNTHRLSIPERVALLEKVALAVQHAHQNLVIHRDLKPTNVLVMPDGIPKLVDFGIAKLIELPDAIDTSEEGLTTLFGQRALTPDFASPEQILDGSVSTASDIYSLGVLATLILTGQTPYRLDTQSPRSLLESFERKTVPRASELVARDADARQLEVLALERRVSATRLRRLFRGDVDNILLTALNAEPSQRYASADALRRDFNRYRTGQPIVARGASMASRTIGLMRAHKLAFSALTATIVALSVGLSIALWQARIAQQRFADLHDFSRVVLGEIYDSVTDLPGSTQARHEITSAAQIYLDRLVGSDPTLASKRLGNDALLADLALAYKRLADVQGLPTNANLGESSPALKNYQKALLLARQVADETPQAMSTRAQIHQRMADVLSWQGKREDALSELERAHGLFAGLLDMHPTDDQIRSRLAFSYTKIGDLMGHPSFPNLGDDAAAAAAYATGLRLFDNNVPTDEQRDLLRAYGVLLERSGTMALQRGDTDAALSWYTRSAQVRARLAAVYADHTDIKRDAGIAIEMLADVHKTRGELSVALTRYREALDVYRQLARIDAANANAQRTLAIGLENLAEALLIDQQNALAADRYVEALAIRELLVQRDPDSERLASEMARTRTALFELSTDFVSRSSLP